MITTAHTQEALSRACIHAVAASAGVNYSLGSEFDYGFDGTFRPVVIRNGQRRIESGFPLDFQLKCSWNWAANSTHVSYQLKTKTYNDLVTREPSGVGAVLILMCLPEPDADEWVSITEESIVLRKCCYFTTVTGVPIPNENSTKLILIPRTNLLNAISLLEALKAERERRIGAFA
jgi:hypothetical protein